MAQLKLTFVSAADDAEMDANVDETWTDQQVINALVQAGFIPPPDETRTYFLEIKGGSRIMPGTTLADAGARQGSRVRVLTPELGGAEREQLEDE
jgi:hypothetical protein